MPRPWTWLKIGMILEWLCFLAAVLLGSQIEPVADYTPANPSYRMAIVGGWLLGTLLLFFRFKIGVTAYIATKLLEWNLIGYENHGSIALEAIFCIQWFVFGCVLFLVFAAQAANRSGKAE